MTQTSKNILAIIVIILVGAFYVGTIDKSGPGWGDENMYLHHAKNLAEGKAYQETGYIYNPNNPIIGPKAYPPAFPVLLAVMYKLFGFNLLAMRIEILFLFMLFLFVVFKNFSNHLSFFYALSGLIILGFSPWFWIGKNSIASEIPFLLFVYLVLLLVDKQTNFLNAKAEKSLCRLFFIGVFMYISFATRTVGAILCPSLIVFDFLKHKKLTRLSIVPSSIFVLLALFQCLFSFGESSYLDQLLFTRPKEILNNFYQYGARLSELLFFGRGKLTGIILLLIFGAVAAFGYMERIKNKISIYEIFVLPYVVTILIWPVSLGIRALWPLFPLFVFYIILGINEIFRFRHRFVRTIFFTLFLLLIAAYNSIAYVKLLPAKSWVEGPSKKESVELFEYIRSYTPETSVFIFYKPRALSLSTARRASGYHQPRVDGDLWNYFYRIGATHVVVGPNSNYLPNYFRQDVEYLQKFVGRNKSALEEIFFNADFKLYRIKWSEREKVGGAI